MPYAGAQFEPQQKLLSDFGGGVSFEKPSTKIGENQFTSISNLQYFKNTLRVDSGYSTFRQQVQGTPQASFQFIQTNGTVQTLLWTTKFLYMDNGFVWVFVGDGVFTAALSAQTNGGSNLFTLTSVVGLIVGDPIGITLNDNSELQTTVTAIAGNVVSTHDAVPPALFAPSATRAIRPRSFNGGLQFQPVGVTWPNTNEFFMTNGIDPLQFYDGTFVRPVPGWAGVIPRSLVTFHGFLLAFDTTENGVRFPQRRRNSNQNDPGNITTGLAGLIDLTDTEDTILAAVPLGPWIILYREASIMRTSYIGDPLQLFFDEYTVTGVGVFSQNAVADTGSTHVFAGPEGIYRYSGGYDIEDVGNPIFDQLLGPQGVFNTSQAFLVICFYVAELDEVWLMVPTGGNTWLDTLYRLDQELNSWWIRMFLSDKFVGFGFLESQAGRTWQQATIPWNQDTTTWLSHSKREQAPLTLLLAQTGFARLYDYTTATDAVAVISWTVTSKDFASPAHRLRIDGFYGKGVGNNVLVELSFDEGNTWVNYGTLNFGLTPTTQQLNDQYSGIDVCRFRLSGSDPIFSLDWARLDYYEETYWP